MNTLLTDFFRSGLGRFWRPGLVSAAALVWLATRNSSGTVGVVAHYGALAAALGLPVFWRAGRSRNRAMVLATGLAGTALVLLVYCWNETYIQRWADVNETRYEDRRRRWGGAVEHRRVKRAVGDELAWEEGPVVAGEPHGLWQRHEQRPPRVEPVWYWQGKRVSEAEWKRLSGP